MASRHFLVLASLVSSPSFPPSDKLNWLKAKLFAGCGVAPARFSRSLNRKPGE